MANRKVAWSKRPLAQDFAGAAQYLDLIYKSATVRTIVKNYRRAVPKPFAAKDLLRASGLPLLPRDDVQVVGDLKRIRKGKPLAPILLVRGDASSSIPLNIADGYHRICAICYFDETAPVP
jgi:hypothetical protein